jgi:calcineurin-like phosphoesterase family protein
MQANKLVLANEVMVYCNDYKMIKDKIKAYEKEIEMLKAQIVGVMGNNDEMSDITGKLIVTYKPSVREVFDMKTFKDKEASTYQKYTSIREVKTFLVK